MASVAVSTALRPDALRARYDEVRAFSLALAAPLSPEDCAIQSMPDVSPTRWHLAHTTWFFETFLLAHAVRSYAPYRADYDYLFNSYYNTIGEQFARPRRGLLSRPSLDEVRAYRAAVDERVRAWLASGAAEGSELLRVAQIGLEHERQHQELILTDVKHVLSCNPLFPAYDPATATRGTATSSTATPSAATSQTGANAAPPQWCGYEEGLREIGARGDGFAFDNEHPRHRTFVHGFELASRPVTNGELLRFVEGGGYGRHDLWLSDGWDRVRAERWRAPLYWVQSNGGTWREHTLAGLRPLELDAPACHLSYYEADAYARWADARLPTEAEWEVAAAELPIEGNFVESGALHPRAAAPGPRGEPAQMFGDVWEWTQSAYAPYPGYRTPPGAIGEYNAKFMCNQIVLRGGSCASARDHVRASYRNFFPAHARWQFSGLRLARDAR